MQFPVSHITILVLVIHTAVGCCWHHAHECVTSCCDSPPVLAKGCPCETHQSEAHTRSHEQLDKGEQPEGGRHRHEQDCDGDHCTFMRSERSSEECGEPSLDSTVLTWDASVQEDSLIRPQFVGVPDCPTSGPAPPIRSHLLLRVLLI